ncbi:MAG: hypothetical protein KDA32_11940 [Phycisphaerales bacterium]|nr:hypothetical protein [Phycisphaerales bacterium]
MSPSRRVCWILLLAAGVSTWVGCSKPAGEQTQVEAPNPVTPPTNVTTSPAPEAQVPPQPAQDVSDDTPRLLVESQGWDTVTALMKLLNEDTRLSAAVRLARLSEVKPACLPDPIPDSLLSKLTVEPLSDLYWAIGLPTDGSTARLRCPVLIEMDGTVIEPADGAEAETALLYAPTEAGFPSVIITPHRLLLISERVYAAAVGKDFAPLRFEMREKDGIRYVALVLPLDDARQQQPDATEAVEVAQYRWDAYERLFVGPISASYPEPYNGRFEMDLELSEALLPKGGDLEVEPLENKPPPGIPGTDPNQVTEPPF